MSHPDTIIEANLAGYTISTDRSRLDLDLVHRYLSEESYWSPGIPKEIVRRAAQNSLCFGLYEAQGRQMGYARVISDYATFAYLADVFILEAHRGRGLGKQMVAFILAHPALQGLRAWMLATRDAHGLYTRFGFTTLADPQLIMAKSDPQVYQRRA